MEGINEGPVTDWLVANTAPVSPPLTFELIAGGRSNLTYLVTDSAGRKLVLRRPPISHVLATAHDMSREHRIISALQPTVVPVAPALGLCEDPAVYGAPFYVRERVLGHIVREQLPPGYADEPAQRRAIGEGLIDVLAALHQVDPDAVRRAAVASAAARSTADRAAGASPVRRSATSTSAAVRRM